MTFRIVFDHAKERDEHARRLVRKHLKKYDDEYPRIVGASLARQARTCSECECLFWATGDSYRFQCPACDPPTSQEKAEIGFG